MTQIFSDIQIAGFAVTGALAIIIPTAALIVYKLKNREVEVSSFFIGCLTFLLFALILESLLHRVMIPLVADNIWLYALYGAFAAGIFEETGRFVAFKLFFKGRKNPKESVMYGLGHGGFEAAALAGLTYLSIIAVAVSVNQMGIEKFAEMSAAGNAETAEAIRTQINVYKDITFSLLATVIFERLLAMTFHTAASVLVFEAAVYKKSVMYPLAILIHAALDFPAALYQVQALSMPLMYILFGLGVIVTVIAAIFSYRRMKKKFDEHNAEAEQNYQTEKARLIR